MKHDVFGLRLFIQWALGRHKAWAHGPGGPRARPQTKGLGVMSHTIGSRIRAQVNLGTLMSYSIHLKLYML